MENKTYYKTKEVQEMLGVGRNTLYDMINENMFPVIKRKKIIRIPKKAFDKWFASFSQDGVTENNSITDNSSNINLKSLKNHIHLIDNMIANLKLIKSDLEKIQF